MFAQSSNYVVFIINLLQYVLVHGSKLSTNLPMIHAYDTIRDYLQGGIVVVTSLR